MAHPRRRPGLRTDQVFRLPGRRGLRFHVYARGIRWDRPLGVVYFFGGDYYVPAQTAVRRPTGATLLRLGAIANARNLVLIAVDTPDRRYSPSGLTWWVRSRLNGRIFRLFAMVAARRLRPDPALSWVMGYSGGAEFLTYDLLAHRVPHWLRGGAVMVGGGGVHTAPLPPPAGAADLPLHWWTGDADGSPEGSGPLWSAQAAAAEGLHAYREAGWRGARAHTVPGVGHRGYDLPGILRASLPEAP